MGNKERSLRLLLVIIFTVAIPSKVALADFTDITSGDARYIEINYLQELGIISGYEDGSFRPDNKINRAEALKMITTASDYILPTDTPADTDIVIEDENIAPIDSKYAIDFDDNEFAEEAATTTEPEEPAPPFSDTPHDQWFTEYIQAAKDKGVISGYPDGSFHPEENINLVEAMKIILESFGESQYPDINNYQFADTSTNDWYSKYIAYGAEAEMLDIWPSNKIYPEQEMSRGYMAELIYKKIRHDEGGYGFGKATYYGKAVQGNKTASGEIFDYNQMTAAHKTLPFGTVVEVTNISNGKSVQVRITDRGPYGPGRVIDLTSAAFSEIASLGAGVVQVQYKIVE